MIYIPSKKDIKKAASVLTYAFFDYPSFKLSIPNDDNRIKKLQVLFEILVKYSIKYAKIYATSKNIEGIMLYRPPNKNISNWKMIKCGTLRIPFKIGIKFIKMQKKIDKEQERLREKHANFPHGYLWSIAVNKEVQNQGYGKILINYLLDDLRKTSTPCYLETTRRENVNIYNHIGFKLIEEYHIKEIDFDIFTMIWKP
jgi:hypothetical protein